MTRWIVAWGDGFCGGCNRRFYRGEPLLAIVIGALPPKYRCSHCEEAPPTMPDQVELQTREQTSVRDAAQIVFSRIHRSYFEQKAPLFVEREPGEEG